MPDMLQTAIGQQTGQYPGGQYSGATISTAPPAVGSLDPNFAYQYDLPHWMQNAIYAAMLPARGVVALGSAPQEFYHRTEQPLTRFLMTGSPWQPGQAPSWAPSGFQPRTDPATNAMRTFANTAEWAGEIPMSSHLTPDAMLLAGSLDWTPPDAKRPWPKSVPSEATPESIFYTKAKATAEYLRRKELYNKSKTMNDIIAREKGAQRTFGIEPDWEKFNKTLKGDIPFWRLGQTAAQKRAYQYGYARRTQDLNREMDAAEQIMKQHPGALPRDYLLDLQRRIDEYKADYAAPPPNLRRPMDLPERPTKFRGLTQRTPGPNSGTIVR